MLSNLFPKTKYTVLPIEAKPARPEGDTAKPGVPDGLFVKCPGCGRAIYTPELQSAGHVCAQCQYHFRLPARDRIAQLVDAGSFKEWDASLASSDPLGFPGYPAKLKEQAEKTGECEGIITGRAALAGMGLALGLMDPGFMMGSMGEVVGEKIVRLAERATDMGLPLVIFSASGGARMQEGIVSLMQMARTSAALSRHSRAGLLYVSVLTDPTTGGVTASFAMLGDIILAEPGALIGFAGPRVIEQTIKQKLPEGFQRAEFLLEQGFVDAIVPREGMRDFLARILLLHPAAEREGRCVHGTGTETA